MKKMRTFVVIISLISLTMSAQGVSKHAFGIRFGDNNGFGGELTYQRKLSEINRFELNLGYRNQNDFDAYKLSGIYQWIWNIDGGFNWYAGFGAGIGSWNDSRINSNRNDGLFINADGDVGIEYNFGIPLLISLDFRPEIGIIGNYGSNTDLDIALSLRYKF
ncbi:hypothetical protein [Lutibacter sp.]|uniref:hypothetical protein n=1 Tax=Lutibacter sp. TaxID=1925666 RepID=UPI0025B9CCA6|nr:hypothetical protein [Lutibacter sp.]MCF6182219.1 hypothetical protein [Lutibacter sp.]